MGKFNNYFCNFIAIVLFSNIFASANLVPDACKQFSQKDPENIKYDFCMAAFGSDPRSASATSMLDLGWIAFQIDISKAKSIVSVVDTIRKDPKTDPSSMPGLKDCSELYSSASEYLVAALDAYKKGDISTANAKASGAMDSSSTCEDGFKDLGKASPLNKENADFFELTAISLSFTV